MILISTALVLLVFPVFFKRTLAEPLENLLAGIRRVNRGDLETRITPRFMDEIGFITLSFNQMVSSLSEATSALEMERSNLEVQIKNRTSDLININTQLEEEVRHRKMAEGRLNRQLRYEIALSGCSQSLLAAASDKSSQQEVLERALQYLLSGAQASRAYICRVFEDPELGTSISPFAEVCAPGIPEVINVPGPRKLAMATFPAEFMATLSNGDPFGGPVKAVFADAPLLQTYFLNQQPPLLSLMILPIIYHQQFWGLIGFDDCSIERAWESVEISLLGTASGMISNTLQRWETQSKLKATLDELEVRVEERTTELSLSNRQLNQEIVQRHKIQHDLEIRLQVEEILANISTRLLATSNSRDSLQVTLQDLAHVIEAGRIFLVEFDSQTIELRDFMEWHNPETQPVSRDIVLNLLEYLHEFSNTLGQDETFYVEDTTHATNLSGVQMRVLHERNVKSIVLVPLTIDGRMYGILGCTNLTGAPEQIRMNLRVLDLVAGMLKGLLQREYLIQTLEDQVVERTRQLTTFLDVAMLGDQAQDLTDILQPTLLSITQIVNCDAATIHSFQEESSRLKMIAQRGIPLDFMQPLQEIKLDSRAIDSLKAPVSSRSWGTREMDPNLLKPFQISGYHGLFLNYLTNDASTFSVLSCYRAGDRAFSHFETTLFTALAELVGIIVENSRLRSEAEELAVFEERQRLAREIHDAVSQSVYSLSLFARSAQDALGESNESKLLASLQDIEATALGAMREMRLLLYQLNTDGQVTDIAAALDARFGQVENRLGIQVTCEVEAGLVLPKHLQYEIWRVLIEALNNAVKHAHPTQVHVQITLLEEALLVCVQDDGVGFEVRNDSAGMGLRNIQGRVETLGGILEIITSPGHGTQIKIMIPAAQPDLQEGG